MNAVYTSSSNANMYIQRFAHWRQMGPVTSTKFGIKSRDFIVAGDWLPDDVRSAWISVADQALDCVSHAYQRAGAVQTLRLHGDCHPGNLLWTDENPHFIDFDDSRTGPAIQDIWMLLSGNEIDARNQLAAVLRGYAPAASMTSTPEASRRSNPCNKA